MPTPDFEPCLLAAPAAAAAFLMGLAAAAPVHAGEIYKWVDANGQTHYSARKEDAGRAKASEVKVMVAPAAPTPQDDRAGAPGRSPAFQPPLPMPQPPTVRPMVVAPPAPRRESYRDETDSAKCALARDILSGAARRANGKPTDANDRQIAESDVRLFCNK